jgi:hypothetical protein
MAELKTRKTGKSVSEFIGGLKDDGVRKDCRALLALFKDVTGAPARMWGPAIVGFGDYRYKSKSQEYEWFLAGFSPRKQNLTLYLMSGYEPFPELMKRLGKHSTGRSCLYIKRLSDVDLPTLKALIQQSTKRMKADPRFAQ